MMADLDGFKAVNDTGGHAAGDALIAAVAQVLRSQQRPNDIIGRLGGEEFAFVLPGADLDACGRAAERIRAAVEALTIEHEGRRYGATLSLGCAAGIPRGPGSRGEAQSTLAALLRGADAALYRAKDLGRNRVERGEFTPRADAADD
jgi:diguanylate cyclase (GGDEF)-like protein